MFGQIPSREDHPGSNGRNENSGRQVNQVGNGISKKPQPISPDLPPGNVVAKEKFYSTDEE